MAWNLHWQVCFTSLGGTQYAVNIYDQSYSGSVVQLTGSANPFTTQEDDDDDYFAPVRVQTGYVRVIDYDGTLLEQLIPANNTERLVRLYYGTYSNGTFTPSSNYDALQWQGFLMADAFTQPIDNNANEIELPVRSVIGALEDITVNGKWYGQEKNIATIIKTAFDTLGVTPEYVYVVSDINDFFNNEMRMKVNLQAYVDRDEQHNEGTETIVYSGDSYLSVIQDIATLFGLQLREHGGDIYLSMYDNVYDYSDVYVMRIPWSAMTSLSNDDHAVTTTLGTISDTPLPTGLQSMGNDNEKSFEPGVNDVKVEVSLDSFETEVISMPSVDEDASTVYQVALYGSGGVLYAQPHPFSAGITSIYRKYELVNHGPFDIEPIWEFEYLALSSYSEVLASSSLVAGSEKRHVEGRVYNIFTGIFPVRWFIRKNNEPVKLKDGLYFVHQFYNRTATPVLEKNAVFFTGSKATYNSGGYFCIKMNMTTFNWAGDTTMQIAHDTIGVQCVFCIGGTKFWDGRSWSDSEAYFYLEFDENGRIITNKTSDMNVEGDDGYFIPFSAEDPDGVSFVICDVVGYQKNVDIRKETYASIISEISVSVQYADDNYTASKRNSNVYLLTDISTGFSGNKDISVSIGTINNNLPSPSLIKDPYGDYVEEVGYNSKIVSTYPAPRERPERHLIYRMRRQYAGLRRTLSMQIQNVRLAGIDAMAQRWAIDGHAYFGVLSDRNWRDDTDTVKFIEVL